MPNWCLNRLIVTGPNHGQMATFWRGENILSRIAPQPDTFSTKDVKELRKSTFPTESVTKENAWWWWRNKHWGTKWDIDGTDVVSDDDETIIFFLTAWSPPTAAVRTLSASFSDLCFSLDCCEPAEHFAATTVCKSGEIVSHNYHRSGPEYQALAEIFDCEDEEDEDEEDEDEEDLDKEELEEENPDWQRQGF